MVKFLKFILFVIIIVFAFALGVKFSDSFKGSLQMGTPVNPNETQIKIETEMDKAFDNTNIGVPAQGGNVDVIPLTDTERNQINDGTQQPVIEYIDIDVMESMDNIPNTISPNTNTQVAPNVPTPATPNAPVVPTVPTTPTAPNTVPTAPNTVPAQNKAPTQVPPTVNKQPARR